MKALKDCFWEVEIIKSDLYGDELRKATVNGRNGTEIYKVKSDRFYTHKGHAKRAWKHFALLNKITNYKLKEK